MSSTGELWAWGDNAYGQLGDGSRDDRLRPFRVPGLTGVADVAGGFWHTLVRLGDGLAQPGQEHLRAAGGGAVSAQSRSHSDRLRRCCPAGSGNVVRAVRDASDMVLTWIGTDAQRWQVYRDTAPTAIGMTAVQQRAEPDWDDFDQLPIATDAYYVIRGLSTCSSTAGP